MKSADYKIWCVGVLIIIIFTFLGELSIAFHDYIFYRIGLNRNLFLSLIWLTPVIVSFMVTRFSSNKKALKGLSLILVISFTGPLFHFFLGRLGVHVDFPGKNGLKVVLMIYFSLALLAVSFGVLCGILFSKNRA